ncbi:Zinc knuckle CX2CX4HX4C [Trema orientale]|uniref:Zinc knuckle CX2CX4HX4C n=1 Tax=Trema orientale TaxID=63057 RepID=A0A2P5EAM7_TREOI|nr:Zinc knuckle CX2CX4HX4C [Trema orientale]
MSTKLDRYTSAYLLSGYGINEFKLRTHADSALIDDSEDDGEQPSQMKIDSNRDMSQLKDDNNRVGTHGLDVSLVDQSNGAHGLVGAIARVSDGAHGLVSDGISDARVSDGPHGLVSDARVSDRARVTSNLELGDHGRLRGAARVTIGAGNSDAAKVSDGAQGVSSNQQIGAHGLVRGAVRASDGVALTVAVPSRVLGGAAATHEADHRLGGAAARVLDGQSRHMLAADPSKVVHEADLGLQPRAAGPSTNIPDYMIIDSSLVDDGHEIHTLSKTLVVSNDGYRVSSQTKTSQYGRGANPDSDKAGLSFAQVLGNQVVSAPVANNVTNIAPESSKPSIKGNYVCVKVNQAALQNRLELCQYSVIGRIFLSKGDSPWKLADLKFKLQSIWGLSPSWRLISLGRGFFHILLSSEVEKSKVWGMGSMNLKLGVLRLQPWFPNFNPHTQSSTNAQVWVRFHELPWVYWDRQILSDLARGIGVPIRFDEMTLNGEFGHYARMLIDIDLSQPISDSLMVEVGSDCLFILLEYERLSSFCCACKFIGHEASTCRRVQKLAPPKEGDKKSERGRSRSRKAVYRPIVKSPKATDIPVENTHENLEGHTQSAK